MSTNLIESASNIASNAMRVSARELDLLAANTANADLPDYQEKYLSKVTDNGSIRVVAVMRRDDPARFSSIISESSSMGTALVLNDYLKRLQINIGTPGEENTIAHFMQKMENALNAISSVPNANDQTRVRAFLNSATDMTVKVRQLATLMQDLRSQAEADFANSVIDCNQRIDQIYALNGQIQYGQINNQDVTELQSQRDQAIRALAENIKLNVQYGEGRAGLSTSGGIEIIPVASAYVVNKLNYTTPGSLLPTIVRGSGLSDITLAGTTMTTLIKDSGKGRLSGLLKLIDDVIPNLQKDLDELTRAMRDNLNQVANKGAAVGGDTELLSQIYVPGTSGVISGATVVSGSGVIKFARIGADGKVTGYTSDITLGANMPIDGVGSIVAAINAATSTPGSGAGNIVASFTGGKLSIKSSVAGEKIALCPVQSTAKVCSGAAYSAGSSFDFGHFFGFNNLVTTGAYVANTGAATVGIANLMDIDPRFVATPQLLMRGKQQLEIDSGNPKIGIVAVRDMDNSTLLDMYTVMRNKGISFQAAGNFVALQNSFKDYAANIIYVQANLNNQWEQNAKAASATYETLDGEYKNFTGVNLQDLLIKAQKTELSMAANMRVLNAWMQMNKTLIESV